MSSLFVFLAINQALIFSVWWCIFFFKIFIGWGHITKQIMLMWTIQWHLVPSRCCAPTMSTWLPFSLFQSAHFCIVLKWFNCLTSETDFDHCNLISNNYTYKLTQNSLCGDTQGLLTETQMKTKHRQSFKAQKHTHYSLFFFNVSKYNFLFWQKYMVGTKVSKMIFSLPSYSKWFFLYFCLLTS